MIIFVTGNSRSGTTMMSRILGNHAKVFSFQELHYFDEMTSNGNGVINHKKAVEQFATLCAIQRNGYFGSHNGTPFINEAKSAIDNQNETSASLLEKFLYYESLQNKKKIPCEQTPQNIFYLDVILKQIKDARVIIMVRDPREVLLSQKNKWKRRYLTGNKFPLMESIRARINYHPVTISRIWNATIKEAIAFSDHPSVKLVHYESIIEDAEKIIREVCSHCNIDYSPAMLDVPVVGSSNFNDNPGARGIDKNKSGMFDKGGLTPEEIFLCQEQTGRFMDQMGYKKINVNPAKNKLAWLRITQPFRLALALLFNLKRLRHPRKLIKRFF